MATTSDIVTAPPDLLAMSMEEMDGYIGVLQENFRFEDALKIINATLADKKFEEAGLKHERLLLHAAACNIELKTEDSKTTAIQFLDKAVELNPSTGYLKYLTYAQLMKGAESISKYQLALDILKKEIESLMKEKNDLKKSLSDDKSPSALSGENRPQRRKTLNAVLAKIREVEAIVQGCHTAMGEVYLTDLQDEDNALSLAAFHGKEAKIAAKSVPIETRLLLVHVKSLQMIDPENVTALTEAKSEMREIALEFENLSCEVDVVLLKKCIMAALSIECFVETHSMVLIMEEIVGLNNFEAVAVWAAYHRALAIYHLKGFHHYAPRLIQIVEGLEMANETTESVKETKSWIDDLVGSTVQAISTGEESDGGMEFEEKCTNESFYHQLETKYDLEATNPEVIVLSDNEIKKAGSNISNSITLDSSSDDESVHIVEVEPKIVGTVEPATDNDCQILNGEDEAATITTNPNIA